MHGALRGSTTSEPRNTRNAWRGRASTKEKFQQERAEEAEVERPPAAGRKVNRRDRRGAQRKRETRNVVRSRRLSAPSAVQSSCRIPAGSAEIFAACEETRR